MTRLELLTQLELDDIQGLVARGYPDLKAASYVLLRIDDPASARSWLAGLIPTITPAPAKPSDLALNVAFTPGGLRKLGLPPDVLAQFSNEFTAGMTTPHRRRMFGDFGPSAPEQWRWGGPTTEAPDILLLILARDTDTLTQRRADLQYRGVSEIISLDATTDLNGKEHFGFTDGISQPTIEGLSQRKDTPPNTIRAGEFILGYVNEYGLYTDAPPFARNGTYLVMRQLAQDVRGFWRFVDHASRGPDGASDPTRRTWLAAHLVGRWPSGAPVTLSPDSDDPQLSGANDFTYQYADEFGFNCPIGAHVRRSHPRDSLDPAPGTARSVELDKRHRLLRRGREYGPPVNPESLLDAAPPDDPERGLFFICLAGNIGRQFEFVQHSWVNNPKFDELYDEPDPVVGYHPAGASNFSLQGEPVREKLRELPQFITTRGGGYFFLPGLRALRTLTTLRTFDYRG